MPPKILPGGKVVFLPAHSGDHTLNLNDYGEIDSTLRKEDVPRIGAWQDFNGSGTINPSEVMMQGLADSNFADPLAHAQGIKDYDRTDRGARVATHRTRDKLVTVELDDEKNE